MCSHLPSSPEADSEAGNEEWLALSSHLVSVEEELLKFLEVWCSVQTDCVGTRERGEASPAPDPF